jgi:hypothetical protein
VSLAAVAIITRVVAGRVLAGCGKVAVAMLSRTRFPCWRGSLPRVENLIQPRFADSSGST